MRLFSVATFGLVSLVSFSGGGFGSSLNREIIGFLTEDSLYFGYTFPADEYGNNFYQCGHGPVTVQVPENRRVYNNISDCPLGGSVFASVDLSAIRRASVYSSEGIRIGDAYALFTSGEQLTGAILSPEITGDYALTFRVVELTNFIPWISDQNGEPFLHIQGTIGQELMNLEAISMEDLLVMSSEVDLRVLEELGHIEIPDSLGFDGALRDLVTSPRDFAIEAFRYPENRLREF